MSLVDLWVEILGQRTVCCLACPSCCLLRFFVDIIKYRSHHLTMKKLHRLKLKSVTPCSGYPYWKVVGYSSLQLCGNIMPRFGLTYGSDYIMSIRTTPKNTHFKITMSKCSAGFWQWQCDAVPLGDWESYRRFFNDIGGSTAIIDQIRTPGTTTVDLWIKFRKIS